MISKHFMFTVNLQNKGDVQDALVFQNISCLRLIEFFGIDLDNSLSFQNISCLRLIKEGDSLSMDEL